MSRLTRVLGVVAVVAVLAGCAAPPEPSTGTDSAAALPTPEWTPDLTINRDFEIDGREVSCTILMGVIAPESPSSQLTDQIVAAQRFLRDGDWDSVEVSLGDYDPDDLAIRRTQGVSDGELLSMLVTSRIRDDLAAAGLNSPGLSTRAATTCA